MERRAVGVIKPVTGVKGQQLQFGPFGEIRRFVNDKSPRIYTGLDGHAEERTTGRAAQQGAAPDEPRGCISVHHSARFARLAGERRSLYGQERTLRLVSHPGGLRLLGVHRGAVLLHAAGVSRAAGPGLSVSISVVTTEREEPSLLRSSGSSGHIGVKREATGSLEQRRAVSASVANGWPLFLRRSGLFGRPCSSRPQCCMSSSSGIGGLSPPRRFGGCSHGGAIAGVSGGRGAHSSGRITTGCTRRRRAGVADMQATVNRGRRQHSSGGRVLSSSVTLPAPACIERSVGGAVDRGLSGRAAPLVNRNRYTDKKEDFG